MKTAQAIKNRIQKYTLGEPFTTNRFISLGSRQAIDTTLSRLTKEGTIVRIVPGVYMRPKKSKYVGTVAPNVHQVVQVIAKGHSETVQIQGIEAARYFKLTTQVPNQIIYYTNGTSRELNIGKLVVRLKHVSQSKLLYANSKIGLAITALIYLGKEQVNNDTLKKIKEALSEKEFSNLMKAKVPGWLTHKFNQYKDVLNYA